MARRDFSKSLTCPVCAGRSIHSCLSTTCGFSTWQCPTCKTFYEPHREAEVDKFNDKKG